jgi:hypothetical protein
MVGLKTTHRAGRRKEEGEKGERKEGREEENQICDPDKPSTSYKK